MLRTFEFREVRPDLGDDLEGRCHINAINPRQVNATKPEKVRA